MSRRLTNDDRRTIRNRILEHAFKKREEKLEAEEKALALAAYERIYPKKVRDQMDALPAGFLNEDESVRANVAGRAFDLQLPTVRRVMRGYPSSVTDKCFNTLADDTLGAKILAHSNAERDLKKAKEEASTGIQVALSQMSTVKQCVERWPEAADFVKDLEAKPVTALAVPLRDLNKVLGLPPTTGVAPSTGTVPKKTSRK